jgi:hypothetical protein
MLARQRWPSWEGERWNVWGETAWWRWRVLCLWCCLWSAATSAPDLVYPEEQVGGVQATFYVNYEGRLLARAILFGVVSVGLLVLREQRRGAAAEAPRIHGAATPPRICAPATIAASSPAIW